MATKITRQKDLIYHQAVFLKKPSKNLQKLLEGAHVKLGFASQRAQKFGNDEDNIRLWNKRVDRGLLLCGMFHSYERGRSQLVVQVQDKVAEYPIVATDPPTVKGAKETEFNEGLLFFGIHKNHVLILQSASLRTSAFSDYLNWILQDATDQFSKDNRVELQPTLPRNIEKEAASPLKSIILAPSIHTEPVVAASGPPPSRDKIKEVKMRVEKSDWSWLRDAMRQMGGAVPDDLRLDSDFNTDRLQVNIELRWLGRDKDREETPVLDTIMRAFRDVDDPPIKAVTADGQIFSGNELRLKKPVSIQVDGKIPVPGDVFEQMQKYLAELLERGDISAD